MPYLDPKRQREYKAQWARKQCQGSTGTPGLATIAEAIRLNNSEDVLDLVSHTIGQVQQDPKAGTLEKARVNGFLGGIALKAIKVAELAARVDHLENALADRTLDHG